MANYDATSALGVGAPIRGLKTFVIENEVDLNIAGSNGAAPVASDIIKVLRIPKGSVILAFGCIPKRIAAGTTLTITYDETASKGLNVGGTAALAATGTGMAVGTVAPGTITTAGVTAKTTDTETEDVYITATMTTVTAVTDFGKQKYYAVIAKID